MGARKNKYHPERTITCKDCRQEVVTTGTGTLRCKPCAKIEAAARNSRYQKAKRAADHELKVNCEQTNANKKSYLEVRAALKAEPMTTALQLQHVSVEGFEKAFDRLVGR